jgi:hypothetical protein
MAARCRPVYRYPATPRKGADRALDVVCAIAMMQFVNSEGEGHG